MEKQNGEIDLFLLISFSAKFRQNVSKGSILKNFGQFASDEHLYMQPSISKQ
jgi:hypothetical protein